MRTIEMKIIFYRENGEVRLGEVKNLIAEVVKGVVKAEENFNKDIKVRVDMHDHYDE